MKGDMVGPGALYLILRAICCRMASIASEFEIPGMDPSNCPADLSSLGIPTHAIADLEAFFHDGPSEHYAPKPAQVILSRD
jgi:hypothetical protein